MESSDDGDMIVLMNIRFKMSVSSSYLPEILVADEVISEPGRSRYEWRNQRSFAAIKSDGSVVSWGNIKGTDGTNVYRYNNRLPVQQVFSNRDSYAALRADGKVVSWGHKGKGAKREEDALSSDVVRVFSTRRSFSALKADGRVVSWGKKDEGGDIGLVSEDIQSGVQKLFSTGTSMAALRQDGSVLTWGLSSTDPRSTALGGDIDTGSPRGGDSSAVADQIAADVVDIFSSRYAFAALKNDGSVVAWGDPLRGGHTGSAAKFLNGGVEAIAATGTSFAALKKNGRVVVWGDPWRGGKKEIVDHDTFHWDLNDSDDLPDERISVREQLRSGVEKIFSTRYSYAALKDDGSVVTWGLSKTGGDSSSVQDQLQDQVVTIAASRYAFAALLKDGSVVTWGERGPQTMTKTTREALGTGGFASITAHRYGFAALHSDGSVVSWGLTGSSAQNKYPLNDASVREQLSGGVVEVFTTGYSFAALKRDGSVVAWGDAAKGGDLSAVRKELSSGVVTIASPFSDVATFRSHGDSVTSIVDFDLSWQNKNTGHLNLGGFAAITGKGNDRDNQIFGNSAANRLHGRAGDDSLIGGDGMDRLAGGAGHDRLTGGGNADVFVLSNGDDVVRDFDFDEGDRLEIDDLSLVSMVATSSGSIIKTIDGKDSMLLRNFDASNYTLENLVV